MRTPRAVRGILLALALLVPTVASAQSVNRRVALARDASIRVFNLEGSIRIIGWDKDSLVVTGTLSPGGGKLFYFGGGGRGAKLGVEPRSSGESDGPSNLEVFVPARSKVWIKAATAEVSVSGFSGSLDVYSVSGSIRVDGSPAQVYAESMDGNIEVAGSAPWVRAKTASGAITITGGGEDVAATTVSGTMIVQGARVVRGRFESVTGDMKFDGDVDRGASLTFESHSGVIELRLPSSVSADFNVNEFQGKIVNELTSAAARPIRDRGGQELAFTMGQGGADVTIRNFKGAVLLRRRK
ncbi:MAG: hypothetical protein EXR93_08590 [Gemmatimonadetes bacterium]|nr:hypothetical protein [Gemmatimonadota bacterium]